MRVLLRAVHAATLRCKAPPPNQEEGGGEQPHNTNVVLIRADVDVAVTAWLTSLSPPVVAAVEEAVQRFEGRWSLPKRMKIVCHRQHELVSSCSGHFLVFFLRFDGAAVGGGWGGFPTARWFSPRAHMAVRFRFLVVGCGWVGGWVGVCHRPPWRHDRSQ